MNMTTGPPSTCAIWKVCTDMTLGRTMFGVSGRSAQARCSSAVSSAVT
jgi:hypothetical protein